VHDNFEFLAGLVVIFFRYEGVVFVFDGFAQFATVGLTDSDVPMGVHGSLRGGYAAASSSSTDSCRLRLGF
jgi:hypothetical protein